MTLNLTPNTRNLASTVSANAEHLSTPLIARMLQVEHLEPATLNPTPSTLSP